MIIYFVHFSGCENKMKKVITGSTEENLQPFKDKMESFISTGQFFGDCVLGDVKVILGFVLSVF